MDSSRYYARQGYALSKQIGYLPGQFETLQQLAFVGYAQLRFGEGIEYAKQGLTLAERGSDNKKISVFSNTLGALYDELGDYSEAIAYYQRALRAAEVQPDSVQAARVINNIGVTYYQIRNYDKALDYYEQALRIYQALDQEAMVGRSLSNVASIYSVRGDTELAVRHTQRALSIARKTDDMQQVTYDLLNLAELYYHDEQPDSSVTLVNQAIRLAQDLNDYGILTMAYKLRGTLFTKRGQYKEARTNLNQALVLAQQSGNVGEEQKVHRTIVTLDSLQGNYQQAFLRQTEYMRAEDSLFNAEKIRQVEELQMAYETEKKDQQIALLRSENEVKSLRVSQQNTLRNALISGVLALIVLLGVLYNRYRLKQRSLGLIATQKAEIEQQNQENKTLLREIHHRVKNNLQLILSLLNIQSRRFQDEAVLDFIREGQNRVRSMALVHQDLYQAERLDKIDFEEYLKKMVSHLKIMYDTDQRGIAIELEVHNVMLDVNTAIPLGLIVNELVSNTLKHAFVDRAEGRVVIRLQRQSDNHYCLSVTDDGVGLPSNVDLRQTDSLGLKLVDGLTDQLHGSLSVKNGQGSSFEVTFPTDHSWDSKPQVT